MDSGPGLVDGAGCFGAWRLTRASRAAVGMRPRVCCGSFSYGTRFPHSEGRREYHGASIHSSLGGTFETIGFFGPRRPDLPQNLAGFDLVRRVAWVAPKGPGFLTPAF
jgi:hypothetical protein